jgi:hypothetical protein
MRGAIMTKIIILLTMLLGALVYIGTDHRMTKNQANDFCNSIEIGKPFDVDTHNNQVNNISNARSFNMPLENGESGYLVQFREAPYIYYSCNFTVKDGIILTKTGARYGD